MIAAKFISSETDCKDCLTPCSPNILDKYELEYELDWSNIFICWESRSEMWELMGNILKLNKSVSEEEREDETCLVIILTFWPPVNPVSCQSQDTVNIRYHTNSLQTTCQAKPRLCWSGQHGKQHSVGENIRHTKIPRDRC